MALTIYVTEDFGTMKKKDRFQQRRVVQHSANVHVLEKSDVYHRQLERKAHHARNLPRPKPNSFQSLLEGIQDRWYAFRLSLARWVSPPEPPACVTRDAAKLRYANTLEQRKIIEELWKEIFPNQGRGLDPEMVLRIPVDTEFFVEDE